MHEYELYVITEGMNGPIVAGPYLGYEVAVRARDAMPRWKPRKFPWFFRRRIRYWVEPAREVPGR